MDLGAIRACLAVAAAFGYMLMAYNQLSLW